MVTAFAVGATVSPPDPITQALWFPPIFAASFVAAYLVASTASGQRAAATN